MSIKHVQEKKEKVKGFWLQKKKNIILSHLLFNCNIEKTKIMIFYVNFVSWAYSETSLQQKSFIVDNSLQWTFSEEQNEITLKLSLQKFYVADTL